MESLEFIEALRSLDTQLAPQGIYACEKQTLWSKGLYPLIKSKKFKIGFTEPGKTLCWSDTQKTEGMLNYLSFSEVKVRKFGNAYHQDQKTNTAGRWAEKKIEKALYNLKTEYSDPAECFLMILTFGSASSPFRKEFKGLDDAIDIERLGLTKDEMIWADEHSRGIFIRLRTYKHQRCDPDDRINSVTSLRDSTT